MVDSKDQIIKLMMISIQMLKFYTIFIGVTIGIKANGTAIKGPSVNKLPCRQF
jgi:hypothetical protein